MVTEQVPAVIVSLKVQPGGNGGSNGQVASSMVQLSVVPQVPGFPNMDSPKSFSLSHVLSLITSLTSEVMQ